MYLCMWIVEQLVQGDMIQGCRYSDDHGYQCPQCLLEAGARVDGDTMDVAERLGRQNITKLLTTYLAKQSHGDRR